MPVVSQAKGPMPTSAANDARQHEGTGQKEDDQAIPDFLALQFLCILVRIASLAAVLCADHERLPITDWPQSSYG